MATASPLESRRMLRTWASLGGIGDGDAAGNGAGAGIGSPGLASEGGYDGHDGLCLNHVELSGGC